MMKFKAISLFILFVAPSVMSQVLRLEINGELKGDSQKTLPIFHARPLLPIDKPTEILSGPYTLRLTAQKADSAKYKISAELLGLGPDFRDSQYDMKLALKDPITLPPLPVKGNVNVIYRLMLLDDSSKTVSTEPDMSDTSSWGISVSVHYRTHWLKNSFADFNWNLKMGYLELIYNRYRGSYSLSSFDKIDYYLHPDTQTSAYLDPESHYAIQPRARRIDLVYGHDIDAATPRPAAELLIYRLWGYGPRWMVTGFAGYYSDNLLTMRKLAHNFRPRELADRLSSEAWVDSDTGQIVTGAFVRWLIDNQILSKFIELYKGTTSLDFKLRFEKIYGQKIEDALRSFLEYSGGYKPKQAELEYYASEYMAQGHYGEASEYLQEIFDTTQDIRVRQSSRKNLALCKFWLGDYAGAWESIMGTGPHTENCCENELLAKNMYVASQNIVDSPRYVYDELLEMPPCPSCLEANLAIASILLDDGNFKGAESYLEQIEGKIDITPDYLIALGTLRKMQGNAADSILTTAAMISLKSAELQPQEPANYLSAGQAFMLLGQYGRAEENLNIAYFLEKRPYFIGCTLLELGKLMDLEGKRDKAQEYYRDVLDIKAGGYQKYLAKKYLNAKYELRNGNQNRQPK
jgi:tetratricopeptide (TPR) repeat protein